MLHPDLSLDELESMYDHFCSIAEEEKAELDSRRDALQEYVVAEEAEIDVLYQEFWKTSGMADAVRNEINARR